MTYEDFTAQVAKAENILNAMAYYPMDTIPDVDINIEACKTAAMFTGYDATTAKMLNRKFREDAAEFAFEMALKKSA